MPANMLATRLTTFLLLQIKFAEAGPWVYAKAGASKADSAAQVATWGGLCVSGKEQSPIDVITASAIKTMMPVIETFFDTGVKYVKNTGHGFQLFETDPVKYKYGTDALTKLPKKVADDAARGAKGYSMIGGSKYNFYQVHWHTPSENAVDGVLFAMESHFVHQLDDTALVGNYHRLAVIGLQYELGTNAGCNSVLERFWASFPDTKSIAVYTGANPDLNAKLTNELTSGYYHWYGSLTTPPCTEGVSWNLLRNKETVCQAQVDKLVAGLAATQAGIGFNNRVVQPLNHRAVAWMDPGSPRAKATNTPVLLTGAAKWIYAAAGGTAAQRHTQTNTWGGLCVTGHEQSPINVNTNTTIKTAMPMIQTSFDTTLAYVKNTGHGFQLFETSPTQHKWNSSTGSGAGKVADVTTQGAKGFSMIGGDKFNFYQVHWHTPSENTVDGVYFALEAHFVHQLDDIAVVGGYHRLAVIGLQYEMGSANDCNTFLDYFWASFPNGKGAAGYSGDNPNFNEKLSLELALGYYHWMGSLTTPPCTEGVSWNLLKSVEKTCQAQVDTLKAGLEATQYGIGFNNRVTMPLNHRVVTETTAAPVATSTTTIAVDSDEASHATKCGMFSMGMLAGIMGVIHLC